MTWILLLALVLAYAAYRVVRARRDAKEPSVYGKWQREQRAREKEQAKARLPQQKGDKPRSFSADR